MSMIYRHHHPAFLYHRPPSSAQPPFLGLFLKNLFFLTTAWFAASIAIRMVLLTLSILFSPPVFVLLLLTCVTSWWSFDALRHENIPFPTNTCQSSPPCSPSRRAATRQRRREFCHRFQQQCQFSQRQQQEQSCQKRDNETKPSSTTEDNTERHNKNFQPATRVFNQRTSFDIHQDDQHVTLSIDVPGYSVSDINITVDQDGILAVAGERKNKTGNAFAFQRQFVLNPTTMDTTSITANVVDGLLSITIAKKEIPKPRLITITITTEAQETDHDDTGAEGPSEEEVEEETIVFEKAPVEEDLLSVKKPIAVETVNEDEDDQQVEESDPVEVDHDSWEDVVMKEA
jgi:HSP20 family protein